MVTPEWEIVDSYGPARAYLPGRRESWRGAHPRGRFAGVGRDRPITHARACVAGSLRCG